MSTITLRTYLRKIPKLRRHNSLYTRSINPLSSVPSLSSQPPELPVLQQYIQTITNKGVRFDGRPIYLDSQATTRIDPRVIDIMNAYHVEQWGNPHSTTHLYGWETEDAVENARKQIARLIAANPKEIIFTSGATESNNLAIKGLASFPRRKEKKHIITIQTEHKCVLDSCRNLETQGFEVTYLDVNDNGLVDVDYLSSHIREDTLLVSCMFVNNEIGVIQPIKEVGALCRERGVYFHCDAAQALGKLAIDVDDLNIDIMSMSGHKIYGPKGIGAIYIRRRPRVQLRPIINGGGQERGLRSGTLPAPLCIGFGKACEIAMECMHEDHEHITQLSERLYRGITTELEEIILNGDPQCRYPGNLNLSIAFVEGESLIMGLKNVCVSSGSACTSASLEPSYVLRGIGVTEDLAHTSIRFGIGRFTTEEEIDFTVKETVFQVKRLREMSPLYDLFKEGTLGEIFVQLSSSLSAYMELPVAGGRGRVKGSAWSSPDQIQADKEKKEEEDRAKATPFEEFRSSDDALTIFRQMPFSDSTHQKAFVYIELYKGKVEKTVIYFFKQATCNEFCDLIRRQIFDGVFKSYELEMFLADDEGIFDDKNEPPPGNERLSKIINIGLDSFYFKVSNSWQLSATQKANLIKRINDHKAALSVYQEQPQDDDDDDDDDEVDTNDTVDTECLEDEKPKEIGSNECCIIL